MGSIDDAGGDFQGLAEMLTVAEAAGVLRIGRTLAYRLATGFLAGDIAGLPVVRLGGCLRVPRWALVEFIHHGRVVSDLNAKVTIAIDTLDAPTEPALQPRHRRDRRVGSRSSAQLSLLDGH